MSINIPEALKSSKIRNIVRFTLPPHKVNATEEPSTPTSVQRGVFCSTHVYHLFSIH